MIEGVPSSCYILFILVEHGVKDHRKRDHEGAVYMRRHSLCVVILLGTGCSATLLDQLYSSSPTAVS